MYNTDLFLVFKDFLDVLNYIQINHLEMLTAAGLSLTLLSAIFVKPIKLIFGFVGVSTITGIAGITGNIQVIVYLTYLLVSVLELDIPRLIMRQFKPMPVKTKKNNK
ncbi:hypothetical protein V6O07_21465 [Arthrospira platensis SPKY2]